LLKRDCRHPRFRCLQRRAEPQGHSLWASAAPHGPKAPSEAPTSRTHQGQRSSARLKSECTGAIFTFEPSRTESLANWGRPCTSCRPTFLPPRLLARIVSTLNEVDTWTRRHARRSGCRQCARAYRNWNSPQTRYTLDGIRSASTKSPAPALSRGLLRAPRSAVAPSGRLAASRMM
jgi:hypothetical protein